MLRLFLNQEALPAIAEYQPVEFVAPAGGSELELRVDGMILEPFLRPADPHWRWRWNPGAAIGLHRLELRAGEIVQQLQLQVAPSKIDQEQYSLLTEDLWQTAHDVMLLLGGGMTSAELARRPATQHGLLAQYYVLVEGHLDGFVRAVQRMTRQPQVRLKTESQRIPLGQAAALDPSAPIEQLGPASPTILPQLQAALGGMLPAETQQRITTETHDTYENRLLRRTLDMLLQRVRTLHAAAQYEIERSRGLARTAELSRISAGCESAQRRLHDLRALAWLADVGDLVAYVGPTPALQRDPSYRVVLRTYLALRRAPQLALNVPLFRMPLAELPQLYEYWCTLQVVRALLGAVAGYDTQSLLDDIDLNPTLRLTPGTLLHAVIPDWKLVLRYQPRYRPAAATGGTLGSLDRHTRVPDVSIEARSIQGDVRLLVLDAKYRLEAISQHASASHVLEVPGVPQDALAEAYAYHAAIGQNNKPCVDWAYLLFPGLGAPEVYPSGAGALPLLPGSREHLDAAVHDWIAQLRMASAPAAYSGGQHG